MSPSRGQPPPSRGRTSSGFDDSQQRVTAINSELDEIKLKTMFRMVEDVTISVGGRATTKKLLYLSNTHASSFGHGSMNKVFNALELRRPNFVIKLIQCTGGRATFQAHIEDHGKLSRLLNLVVPEISEADSDQTERQVMKFMSDCVLPLALATQALVLMTCSNDCTLAVAAEKVFLPVQSRLGDACPFTVIGFGYNLEYYRNATTRPSSVAAQVFESSTSWRNRSPAFHDLYIKSYGENLELAQSVDLNGACSVYIIFEGIDHINQKNDTTPAKSFQNSFVEAMIRSVPSVCVVTHGDDAGLPTYVDLLQRGVPILFLDARERWPLLTGTDEATTMYAKESKCLQNPVTDYVEQFKESSESPPEPTGSSGKKGGTTAAASVRRFSFDQASMQGTEGGSTAADSVDRKKRRKFDRVLLAQEMMRRELQVLLEHDKHERWEVSRWAFLHGMMKLTISQKGKGHKHERMWLWEAFEDLRNIQNESRGNSHLSESDGKLAEGLCRIYFEEKAVHDTDAAIRIGTKYIKSFEGKTELTPEQEANLDVAKKRVASETSKKEASSANSASSGDPSSWMLLYSILTSKHTFSESLYDLEGINRILGEVAQIDRLPHCNTLESSLLLQSAWNCVDKYRAHADSYKVLAKSTYVVMLVLGTLIVAAGVVTINFPDLFSEQQLSTIILGLSLATTMVTSFNSYANPSLRWQQLRAASLEIKSEIWQFRTRSGKYRGEGKGELQYSRAEEAVLRSLLKSVQERVLESADLKKTGFYGKDDKSYAKHHQYSSDNKRLSKMYKESALGSVDNHHSPLQPNDYIEKRLLVESKFYQSRIPRYGRSSNLSHFILICGALSQSALAYFHNSTWAALVGSCVAAIGAWMIFGGTKEKLERYSNTRNALDTLVLWWRRRRLRSSSRTSRTSTTSF